MELRKKVLGLATLAFAASLSVGSFVINANAAEGEPATETASFAMVEGAQVRTEDPSGIRFATDVNEAYKTELAKTLAQALFDDEKNMVRIDMSEYMEKYSVSRLIGAPPGYVGYDEGGQLTEAVRRKPYSVILFDEVEKAHPDVFNVLLQVLDDGRITDGQGRTVDFKNTVIILTSNLGSAAILDGIEYDGTLSNQAKEEVEKLLKRSFRPEFLNRLDEVVFFKPLDKKEIRAIVKLLAKSLEKRLEEKQLKMTMTDKAVDYIVEKGYDPVYGARPLKRYMQHSLETVLAKRILAGGFTTGDTLRIDADENGIIVEKA